MKDEERILAEVQKLARDHLDWTGSMTPEMSLVEDLELDSLRLFTLAAEIENHFRIHLDEGDEAELKTVGSLVRTIRRKLGTQNSD